MTRKSFELVWQNTLPTNNFGYHNFDDVDGLTLVKHALDNAHNLRGESIVIKLTDDIIDNDEMLTSFAENVGILKRCGANVFIVHDFGDSINNILTDFNLNQKFIEGFRVTDNKTSNLLEMILSGYINKKIITKLCAYNCKAIGLSGKDANLIQARNVNIKKYREHTQNSIIDFGFISEPIMINPEILLEFEEANITPVISPIAYGVSGSTHLLNTDLTAAVVASALSAEKLIFYSKNKPFDIDSKQKFDVEELNSIISKKSICPENLSICEAALNAIDNGINTVHIIPSNVKDSLLISLLANNNISTIINS